MCMVRGWANRASGAGDTERQRGKGACGRVQAGGASGAVCGMSGAGRYMGIDLWCWGVAGVGESCQECSTLGHAWVHGQHACSRRAGRSAGRWMECGSLGDGGGGAGWGEAERGTKRWGEREGGPGIRHSTSATLGHTLGHVRAHAQIVGRIFLTYLKTQALFFVSDISGYTSLLRFVVL